MVTVLQSHYTCNSFIFQWYWYGFCTMVMIWRSLEKILHFQKDQGKDRFCVVQCNGMIIYLLMTIPIQRIFIKRKQKQHQKIMSRSSFCNRTLYITSVSFFGTWAGHIFQINVTIVMIFLRQSFIVGEFISPLYLRSTFYCFI